MVNLLYSSADVVRRPRFEIWKLVTRTRILNVRIRADTQIAGAVSWRLQFSGRSTTPRIDQMGEGTKLTVMWHPSVRLHEPR